MAHPLTHGILMAALLTSGALAGAAPAVSGPDTTVRRADIGAIVAAISPGRIEGYVNKLVGFGTRHTLSETDSDTRGIGAARRWIKSELERCGAGKLAVVFDGHLHPVDRRIARPVEIVNVVATLPGTQAASRERLYVVSGHYDSRNSDDADAVGDAPGANDDASGTAAVMELACVMSQYKFDATLIFMAVAAEEQGLYGAADFAEKARQKKLNIAGMFTNDIIGSSMSDDGKRDNTQVRLFAEGIPATRDMPEHLRTLIQTGGENDSTPRQLARLVKEVGERYVPDFKVTVINRRDRYLRGGDHAPFLDRGFAALRFTEPAEDFNHQHQNVRKEGDVQIGDLAQFVDPAYVAQVARVNAAALAALALAPAAPQAVKILTARLSNQTDLSWTANAEPDLAGYRVVWRDTTAATWQHSQYVAKVTAVSMPISKDNVLFGVQAIDVEGNVSPASYPVPGR
ncbi:M20/M25/M40 family metallo-hydrolase [Massilia sp. DWR3-1-1]|uniref:M20/M25/M40 family metallo-hydrolase n=1 Tax=Massilia sp. DWR3-1-1 TaxID=2804559 RepID=UPI003CEB188C